MKASPLAAERPKLSAGLGIHDLLEQSISRSRLGSGGTSEAGSTSLRNGGTAKQLRGVSASPHVRYSKEGKADVSTISQAPSTSAASATNHSQDSAEVSISSPERTAVPERRQLDYAYAYSKSKKPSDQPTGRKPTWAQVI